MNEADIRDTIKQIDKLRSEVSLCRKMASGWNYYDSSLAIAEEIKVRRIFTGSKTIHSEVKLSREEASIFIEWLRARSGQLEKEADFLSKTLIGEKDERG